MQNGLHFNTVKIDAVIDIHSSQATGEQSRVGLSQESIPLGHVIANKPDAGKLFILLITLTRKNVLEVVSLGGQ